jgi:hypothetical protein
MGAKICPRRTRPALRSVRSEALQEFQRVAPGDALPSALVLSQRLPAGDAVRHFSGSIRLTTSIYSSVMPSPDWDAMPGEDGSPFEPKASDWGRIDGRLVALDYSITVYDSEEERAEQRRAALADWDQ